MRRTISHYGIVFGILLGLLAGAEWGVVLGIVVCIGVSVAGVFIISAIEQVIYNGVEAGMDIAGRKINEAIDRHKQNRTEPQKLCDECGSPVSATEAFCNKCGAKIEE